MDLNIERGSIYEYIEKDGTIRNRVLIVADKSRSRDNIQSALRLSPAKEGGDTVLVEYDSETGTYWYVHCGCVSYVYRNRLGRKTGEVLEATMETINEVMKQQLGLEDEAVSYKKLYEDMIGGIKHELEQTKYIVANIVDKEPMTHKFISTSVEHEMSRIVETWRDKWDEEACDEGDH